MNNAFPNTTQTAGSHPSYRHEEPASPNTCINLLTGGFLVRVQAEEPFHQQLTAIESVNNFARLSIRLQPDANR